MCGIRANRQPPRRPSLSSLTVRTGNPHSGGPAARSTFSCSHAVQLAWSHPTAGVPNSCSCRVGPGEANILGIRTRVPSRRPTRRRFALRTVCIPSPRTRRTGMQPSRETLGFETASVFLVDSLAFCQTAAHVLQSDNGLTDQAKEQLMTLKRSGRFIGGRFFLLVGLLCCTFGCGTLRNVEQWKCDNWGCCHFGTKPQYPVIIAPSPIPPYAPPGMSTCQPPCN